MLEKLIDDKDFRVRTAADVHLRHFEKSRKAKDFDVAVASSKVLEQHEYYHKWHARQRELVAREQFDGAQVRDIHVLALYSCFLVCIVYY